MDLTGFLGNPGVKSALSEAFSSGRFPHAILFQGEPGTGRRTLASLVARALVCREKDKAPCGACPACVYILVFGERVMEAPQNKLLKLIEEPPGSAVFLMVCRSAQALLPTIRSRAQVFRLMPPSEEEAARWLSEHTSAGEEEALRLAALCGGNLGRMQEEMKSGAAKEAMEAAVSMARALTARGAHELLAASAPLIKDRALCRRALERLETLFRDACVLRCGGGALLGGAPDIAERLASLPMKQLVKLPELTESARQGLERNANAALLVTQLCAALREAVERS